jgi:regulator of replication initiation timing
MAQSKHDFLETFHNKQLKDLDEWVWNWYKLASDRQEEIERLKKQKASETVKETNKKLREENKKLKAKISKISTLTSADVVVAEQVDADAQ